ncbi:MAG: putative sulfate exporter family transporter [Planctomycetota bacterium]
MPRLSEDWLAVLLGGLLLSVCFVACVLAGEGNPLRPWLAAPGGWSQSPQEAFDGRRMGIVGVGLSTLVLFSTGVATFGETRLGSFVRAFSGVFAMALVAYVMAKQAVVDHYGFGYMLWAIVLGLLVANTVGAPAWMRPALRGELFTKVGLVLLGAEVLVGRLLALGAPGVCVAWLVTPVVLVSTYLFGRRVLRIASPTLAIVVAADMSVCGVSAAIATAAACRAKKEELSLAIGMSLLFTAVMMVVLPAAVLAMGLGPTVGGAWIGGTIDSTGAVAAAGTLLGQDGLEVAATIKMIQNVLVGVTAFAVAAYWVTCVETGGRGSGAGEEGAPEERPRLSLAGGVAEVWRRFPKFLLGFLGASIVFSAIAASGDAGASLVGDTIGGATKTLRNWCFCLAFVAIGLDTDFRALAGTLSGGKPVLLYVCGQSLNLLLTLAMAYLAFGVWFPGVAGG